MSYLDRANIGNAKTGGMEKDLQLTSTQYSVILLIFFVGYVLGEGEFCSGPRALEQTLTLPFWPLQSPPT
jgi:hypothetical protein